MTADAGNTSALSNSTTEARKTVSCDHTTAFQGGSLISAAIAIGDHDAPGLSRTPRRNEDQ
jgi:hypothetical protein